MRPAIPVLMLTSARYPAGVIPRVILADELRRREISLSAEAATTRD
jgi:hypothetical protein